MATTYLKNLDMPYNLDQVIRGIQAAVKEEPSPLDGEEFTALLRKFQEDLVAKKRSENLSQAESFLNEISKDPNVVELVPSKLYYKRIREGHDHPLDKDMPMMIYSVKMLDKGTEKVLFSPGDDAVPISIQDTIDGFAQGVAGMLEGEQRTLYIHPDLAYGDYGWKVAPNQLIIIDIEFVH
jgi:peptidylprolyl isomerase